MRAYFFGNMYMSSIQQGIQAQHTTSELFIKYQSDGIYRGAERYLYEWASGHKTSILLNAGFSEEIARLVDFFNTADNPYPWAKFHEGEDALSPGFKVAEVPGVAAALIAAGIDPTVGALTCVGIILPEKIYGLSAALRGPEAEEIESDIRASGVWFPYPLGGPKPDDLSEPYEVSRYELEPAKEIGNYGMAS